MMSCAEVTRLRLELAKERDAHHATSMRAVEAIMELQAKIKKHESEKGQRNEFPPTRTTDETAR